MTGHADPRDDIFVVERPWGRFEQFATNEPVTVKIITVSPGHRLSLQTHDHRGEFWRVLDGSLVVTLDDDVREVAAGESVWVPLGTRHRMANEGTEPVRVLELAFGAFDEADIVRLDDDYAREHTTQSS